MLINDPEIDAIYIATPPHLKLYGPKVAEAGKICCIETINPSYEDKIHI
jgi:predicted dehydrogenase